MTDSLTRRRFVSTTSAGFGAALLSELSTSAAHAQQSATTAPAPADPTRAWPEFPHQRPDLVREIVGVAHSNEQRVRELVERYPTLANASWDWGFGDWESPLGAASHVGRRSIAEYLIERGARMDIFAAAMLGHTDVVKAFVAARPGVQRLLGPHGIPLLAHAKAGGEQSAATVAYLETLGDAGETPKSVPISDEQRQALIGKYRYGDGADEALDVQFERGQFEVGRGREGKRRLHHLGNNEFFPVGAPSVRLRFDSLGAPTATLVVTDGDLVITATRA